MAGRATPDKLMNYKLVIQLYRVINNQVPIQDWVNIFLNNIQTPRQTTFMTMKKNRLRIGMNIISNRFNSLNGKIELDWLNLSYIYYKIKLKIKFFLNVSFSIVPSSPVINEECCKNAKLKIIMHPKQSGIIVTKFLFDSKTSKGLTHSK